MDMIAFECPAGFAVVVDRFDDGRVARVVYETDDGRLLAGRPGEWDAADADESAAWHAAEPWNAH